MAKKDDGTGILVILGVAGFALYQAWEWAKQNIEIVISISVVSILIYVLIKIAIHKKNNKEHLEWVEYLNNKYNDSEVVEKILDGYFWEGQTNEMLIDSLGDPDKKDKKVMKTKVKEVWKYGKIQANQYRLTVNLENNKVIGWNKKG